MFLSSERLGLLYEQACEIELQAFKPGNVSVYADGHDMTIDDFRISAKVSAAPLCNSTFSLGEKIYYAVKATHDAVSCNTNLGIILLAAPLLQAAMDASNSCLRESLTTVLNTTSINDANWVFQAIALASPGGLGEASEQDVRGQATITLKAAMHLASEKDRIAYQYLTDYKDIFDFTLPTYYNGLNLWGSKSWSAAAVYAKMLSQFPDSHIERKHGIQFTRMVMDTMSELSASFTDSTPEHNLPLLYQVDSEFKRKRINPGTTADITVATLLAAFIKEELENSLHSEFV